MIEIKVGTTQTVTLPSRPPRTGGRWAEVGVASGRPVEVRLAEPAFSTVERHAASSLDEIGGLLVGEAFRWQGRLYVEVDHAIAGEGMKAGPAHVTFTAETWSHLLAEQERLLPGKQVVGWYHSHPRMGIFLSDMDLAIHRHFFDQEWHVALVVNGQDRIAGFFAWDGSDIRAVEGFRFRAAKRSEGESFLWLDGRRPPHAYRNVPVPRRGEAARRWPGIALALLLVAGWVLIRARRRRKVRLPGRAGTQPAAGRRRPDGHDQRASR